MSGPGRNDRCPCGSGRKYKQCCVGRTLPAPDATLVRLMQQAMGLHRAGRLGEAGTAYRRALRYSPDVPEADLNLGLIALQRGDASAAAAHYRRALRLRPGYAEALLGLGQVHSRAGRWAESEACLRRALAFAPQLASAWNTLGLVLDATDRADEALECYTRALKVDPKLFVARCNIGHVFLGQDRLDEAASHLERAIDLQPGNALPQLTLGEVRLRQGDVARALRHFERAIELNPGLERAYDVAAFSHNYVSDDPVAILAPHRDYGERFETPFKAAWPEHRRPDDPPERLRIGYVSADFRRHAVATFFEPMLAHHDRARVEVFAYANSTERDEVTARIEALVDHWRPCAGLSDAALAERIATDGIDVLVDLSGHTVGHRLLTFARRPAPVQVTWLGYPATTGLTAIDYRLVTADTDPPGAEAWHSERLQRLPRTLWCYRPDPDAPAVTPDLPSRHRDSVRFVCANNIAKISDASIRVWARILGELPGSTLTITGVPGGSAQRAMRERMKAAGITHARLGLEDKLPHHAFQALLGDCDIALDPWPYNGTTTTCDLLWMGLPVVTLIGRTSAGRSGLALLRAVGLDELAARDEDGYVRIATALARDPARLGALRASLRGRIEASPLRDGAGMARDLEDAYWTMYEAWRG